MTPRIQLALLVLIAAFALSTVPSGGQSGDEGPQGGSSAAPPRDETPPPPPEAPPPTDVQAAPVAPAQVPRRVPRENKPSPQWASSDQVTIFPVLVAQSVTRRTVTVSGTLVTADGERRRPTRTFCGVFLDASGARNPAVRVRKFRGRAWFACAYRLPTRETFDQTWKATVGADTEGGDARVVISNAGATRRFDSVLVCSLRRPETAGGRRRYCPGDK